MVAPDADRFDRLAASYDELVPFFATLGERLVAWVGPHVGQRILDLGTGRGAVAESVARALGPGCDLVAGDVSSQMLARVRALGLSGVEVKQLDTTAMDVPDRSFDVVFSAFLFHFLADRSAALAEVARVLRPGGVFAMSVPGPSTDNGWWDTYEQIVAEFDGRANRRARQRVPPPTWNEQACAAGLRILERENVEVALPVEGPGVHWRWLLSHSHRGLYDALDAAGRTALRRAVLRSLRDEHPCGGSVLIAGADFYRMTTTA